MEWKRKVTIENDIIIIEFSGNNNGVIFGDEIVGDFIPLIIDRNSITTESSKEFDRWFRYAQENFVSMETFKLLLDKWKKKFNLLDTQ